MPLCVLLGRAIVEGAMGPLGVVPGAPALDDLAGLGLREEPVLVQALIPELPVERLDVGVLDGLARADEGQATPFA